MMKKPSVISGFGLAASLVLAAVLFFPGHGGPAAQAAVIMQKLSAQVAQNPRMDIKFDAVRVEEVQLDGRIQVARNALAGDLSIRVLEGGEDEKIEVDVALGMSPNGGWVLLRRLLVPDPAAQAALAFVFPPGTQTLLTFSDPSMFEKELNVDLDGAIAELHSSGLVPLIQGLIDTPNEYGVTIEHQPDGTILLTLPITDAEVLKGLERLADSLENPAAGQAEQHTPSAKKGAKVYTPSAEADAGATDDDHELIGSTFKVVYDPRTELVRSFRIENFGPAKGSISIILGQGDIDPALLDSSRVTTPNTRVLDLTALKGMIEAFEQTHEKHGDSDDE